MQLWRAWTTLTWLSFRRLFWSVNTLMVAFPLAGCVLIVMLFRHRIIERSLTDHAGAFHRFSENFLLNMFVAAIVPICALAYGTSSIGADREDRTLLFLLIRPVPRWLILLAKLAATLPLVVGLTTGTFWICCRIAGGIGAEAFDLYLPSVLYMSAAYVCLFHLFAVAFRHSTIIALVYALFMEVFVGHMPGIIKTVTVNYYGRAMIYQMGAESGLESPSIQWFEPLSAQYAAWMLWAIAAGGVLLAMLVFSRREYRDLT